MNYGIPHSASTVITRPMRYSRRLSAKSIRCFYVVLVTIVVGAFCFQPGVAAVLAPLLLPLAIVDFVVLMVLSFSRRTAGLNTLLLYLFAALEGALLGPLLAMYNAAMPGLPMEAALLTLSILAG